MTTAVAMPTAELHEFSALLDFVYQGATAPSKWPEILPAMADWVHTEKLVLVTPTRGVDVGGFLFTHEVSESTNELWRAKWQSDLWANAAIEQGKMFEGSIVLGQDVVPTAQLLESDWYKQFLSHAGIMYGMWGVVFGVESPAMPVVSCSAFRGAHGEEFGSAEQARMRLLLPHLSRSLGVMLRLHDADLKVAASLTALDHLKTAVVLVRDNGKVVFSNRAARRLLSDEDGLRLKARHGDDSCADLLADGSAAAQAALLDAIRASIHPDVLTTEHFSRSVSIPRFSGRASYVAQFSSLPVKNEFGAGTDAPRAIVFITDPAEPLVVNHDLLRQTYGLTTAEIRTAEVIVQGGTVEDVAAIIGVSENTVRTQLKQIYAKTNVDSRARLVKLVYSLCST